LFSVLFSCWHSSDTWCSSTTFFCRSLFWIVSSAFFSMTCSRRELTFWFRMKAPCHYSPDEKGSGVSSFGECNIITVFFVGNAIFFIIVEQVHRDIQLLQLLLPPPSLPLIPPPPQFPYPPPSQMPSYSLTLSAQSLTADLKGR
jgi:hypothetical protein